MEGFLRSMREPGVGHVVDATDLECSPDGGALAFTAWRRWQVEADLRPTLAVLDLAGDATGARVRLLDDPDADSARMWPRWSPDGERLLCLRRTADGVDEPLIVEVSSGAVSSATSSTLTGRVEQLAWSPDGRAVAVLVAEPGAEISDVFGSGRVAGHAVPDWLPEVASEGRSGWRRVMTGAVGGPLAHVETSWNVWEMCWVGTRHVAAVASSSPAEDAWYDAQLVLIDVRDGTHRLMLRSDVQLAAPAADDRGERMSVVVGTASDRGLVAGEVSVVDVVSGSVGVVDAAGVHVTSQRWVGRDRLLLAGCRGDETVVAGAVLPAATEPAPRWRVEWQWATQESFGPGDLLPVAAPYGSDGAAVALESHLRPPTLGVVRNGAFTPLLELGAAGSAVVRELGSTLRPLGWRSSDGTPIDGYLATPPGRGPGPHPLVVLVHGGPVWRWRDVWLDRTVQVPLLLSRGFAVLLPNPRGSVGHGEGFVRAVVGEVGGLDVDDVEAGVDLVVTQGVTRPETVAVMGTSYGGFLAAWLATRPGRFAAALASSPVTDWVSQHFTTNIPQSDLRFLRGHPLDPASDYRMRSPLVAATGRTSPLLLTAGRLDLATPPTQALEMHRALVDLGVDTDIALYPREGHDVHEWQAVVDHCTRMVLWFERYLAV